MAPFYEDDRSPPESSLIFFLTDNANPKAPAGSLQKKSKIPSNLVVMLFLIDEEL